MSYCVGISSIYMQKGGNDQHEHLECERLSIAKPGSFPPVCGFFPDPGQLGNRLCQNGLGAPAIEPDPALGC